MVLALMCSPILAAVDVDVFAEDIWSALQTSRAVENFEMMSMLDQVWMEEILSTPAHPEAMSAKSTASKAKSRPIPHPTEDSDSEDSLPLVASASSSSRFRSLSVARWPSIHTIKEPFQLTLGGKMQAPNDFERSVEVPSRYQFSSTGYLD